MSALSALRVVEAVLSDARHAESLVICVGPELSRIAGLPVPAVQLTSRDALRHEVADQLTARPATPTNAHKAIVDLAPDAIVTTNYDTLIEAAFAAQGRPYIVVTAERVSPPEPDEGVPVIKLHGSVDRPETIVLNTRDYDGPLQSGWWLRPLFATSLVIAVGFPLGGDGLGEVYEEFGADSVSRQWTIIAKGRDRVATTLWESRGVSVHHLDSQDLPTFFEALRKRPEGDAASKPPASGHVLVLSGGNEILQDFVVKSLAQIGVSVVTPADYPMAGLTVLERFERLLDAANAAVVILDEDVVGTGRGTTVRPNAIYELGFLMGRLGRERVLAVLPRGTSVPSDFSGLMVLTVDQADSRVRDRIGHELRRWAETVALTVT